MNDRIISLKLRSGGGSGSGLIAMLLAVMAWVVFVAPAPACALSIPEKLSYDLSWTGITAGSATQEVIDDGNTIRVISTARSADWISVFFPVEDRIESVLAKAAPPLLGLPQHYRQRDQDVPAAAPGECQACNP